MQGSARKDVVFGARGTLMGKKGRLGRRRITDEDMTRIAEATGMTCDPATCCPERGGRSGEGEKAPEPYREKRDDVSEAKNAGLTPTGAILDLLESK